MAHYEVTYENINAGRTRCGHRHPDFLDLCTCEALNWLGIEINAVEDDNGLVRQLNDAEKQALYEMAYHQGTGGHTCQDRRYVVCSACAMAAVFEVIR